MDFRNCFGMIASVSTFSRSSGTTLPVWTVNFSMDPKLYRADEAFDLLQLGPQAGERFLAFVRATARHGDECLLARAQLLTRLARRLEGRDGLRRGVRRHQDYELSHAARVSSSPLPRHLHGYPPRNQEHGRLLRLRECGARRARGEI